MKLLSRNTKKSTKTINEAFKVGDTVNWVRSAFDGRVSESVKYTGTVVKVNKKTVDVETASGDVFRMDAFIHVRTGEWAVA